jgi:hypothetical protein
MKKVQYELKSRPGGKIWVPEEYVSQAATLVKLGLEAKGPYDIAHAVFQNPFLGNGAIYNRVTSLMNSRIDLLKSLKLQDEIYLRCCIYGLEKSRPRGSKYNEELEQFVQDLMDVVESL